MNGKELQKLIQDSGFSKREWADKTGIPERTIGHLYGLGVVKIKYLNKFIDSGLKIQVGKSGQTYDPQEKKDISHPENQLFRLQGQIDMLRIEVNELRYQVWELKEGKLSHVTLKNENKPVKAKR